MPSSQGSAPGQFSGHKLKALPQPGYHQPMARLTLPIRHPALPAPAPSRVCQLTYCVRPHETVSKGQGLQCRIPCPRPTAHTPSSVCEWVKGSATFSRLCRPWALTTGTPSLPPVSQRVISHFSVPQFPPVSGALLPPQGVVVMKLIAYRAWARAGRRGGCSCCGHVTIVICGPHVILSVVGRWWSCLHFQKTPCLAAIPRGPCTRGAKSRSVC